MLVHIMAHPRYSRRAKAFHLNAQMPVVLGSSDVFHFTSIAKTKTELSGNLKGFLVSNLDWIQNFVTQFLEAIQETVMAFRLDYDIVLVSKLYRIPMTKTNSLPFFVLADCPRIHDWTNRRATSRKQSNPPLRLSVCAILPKDTASTCRIVDFADCVSPVELFSQRVVQAMFVMLSCKCAGKRNAL